MSDKTKQLPPLEQGSLSQQNRILFTALTTASAQLRQIAHDRDGVFRIFCDNFGHTGLTGSIALFENSEKKRLILHAVPATNTVITALEQRYKYSVNGMRFLISDVDVYEQVINTHQPIYLSDISRTSSQMLPAKFKTFSKLLSKGAYAIAGIYAPLVIESEVIGVMLIAHQQLTENDVPLLSAFANHIAQALENVRLYQTQRKMHTALATSRDAWHRLIQQTPIGIQIFDPSGYCTDMNESLIEIYGVNREESIGKFNIFRDRTTQEMGIASAARLALRGETVELENIQFTPRHRTIKRQTTGSIKERIVNITIFPVYDDHDAIVNLVSLSTDVTVRTRADLLQNALYKIAALATSENSLQELYSHIHVIIADLMDANNFFIAIYDEQTNLIHLPYFVDEKDENDAPYPFGTGLIEYVIRTGKALLINDEQHHQLMADGRANLVGSMGPIWLGAPLRTKERTFGVIAVQHYENEQEYTDYHKQILIFVSSQIAAAINRKRAEEKVQALALRLEQQAEMTANMLTTTRTHFYIYDRYDHITYISPSALQTFGIDAADVLEKSWDHLPFPVSTEFAAWMRQVFVSHTFATQEMWLTIEDNLRCYEVQVNPIHEKDGGVENVVMNMLDITDKKITQETLLHTQKFESLGVLAGGIAHDFNNLLVALMGQSSLALAKLPADSEARVHIEKAITAAKQAAELTQQLLAYSGKGNFTMRSINFNHLIHETSHLIDIATPKTVKLLLNLHESLPDINADKGQMQQIIMNLVLNAAEAIPHRGTIIVKTGVQRIRAKSKRFSQHLDTPLAAGQYVYLCVKDDGVGMNEETMARIFDPFYTTKFTGRGLGLAAVLGIVRGHQGGIVVSSRVGKGTLFHLLFPVQETAVSPPQQPAPQTAVYAKNNIVLLIDDEIHVHEAIEDILEMEDIPVLAADNGQAGVDLYRKREAEIGLIILDLSMPGLSGYDTFLKLRKINTVVNIILSSGYSQEEVHRQFAGEQVADFLSKPYDIDLLINKVRHHLNEQ